MGVFSMPNIKYKGNINLEIQNNSDPFDNILFFKDLEYFAEEKPYDNFVKNCERAIRTSKEYKAFERYVTNTLGINFCQVNPNILETDAKLEMHHGPMFTLYDYVSIILTSFLLKNQRITTFRIVDKVIQEHFDLNVQVVMLATTNHEAAHNGDIFLNIKQGVGDVSSFIEKYSFALSEDYKYRIYRYILMCKEVPSFDNGILDIEKVEPLIELM